MTTWVASEKYFSSVVVPGLYTICRRRKLRQASAHGSKCEAGREAQTDRCAVRHQLPGMSGVGLVLLEEAIAGLIRRLIEEDPVWSRILRPALVRCHVCKDVIRIPLAIVRADIANDADIWERLELRGRLAVVGVWLRLLRTRANGKRVCSGSARRA